MKKLAFLPCPWYNKHMKVIFPKKQNYVSLGLMVSGGADSTALLLWCTQHPEVYDSLTVYTFDHRLRGEESAEDSAFVLSLCNRLKVPCKPYILPVKEFAQSKGIGLEESARMLRYRVMERELSLGNITHAVTAHRLEDQAETVLFRMLRGTGLSGAAGMREEHQGILRPMLGVTKAEVLAFLSEHGQDYREDSSNTDARYTRNFLRREIFPKLTERFPSAQKNLADFAALAQQDDDLLTRLSMPYVAENGEITPCAEYPLFSRAAIRILKTLGVTKDYTKPHIDALFALQNKRVGTTERMINGVIAEKTRTGIYLYRAPCVFTPLPLAEGEFNFPFGTCQIKKIAVSSAFTPKKGCLYLDAAATPQSATLRAKNRGDAFIPFGHATEKKVKDFFADKKLNGKQKGESLVLATETTVYAVLPYEISDSVKLTEKTQTAWELSFFNQLQP